MNSDSQLPMPWRKSRFEIIGIKGSFEAYTKDEKWNGWDCPFFIRMEGQRFVAAWNSQLQGQDTPERGQALYDGTNNRFEFVLSGEVESFNAVVINEMELYPIGACGWCWQECESDLKIGDLVTYADPQDETERTFIGTVLGHYPDAEPPRTRVRWENSGLKYAPICTEDPSAWVPLRQTDRK
jgi:hypothetical protein